MIFSPLEQFVIYSFFTWSNFTLIFIVIFMLFLMLSRIDILSNHIEWWYPNMKAVNTHVFMLLTVWFFILFSNLLGMIPYMATITAQFILVLSITVPLFIGINIMGFMLHGFNLFYLILPAGVPLGLTPVIAALEFVSYFIRLISLTLRLAANMIAGHILMKIILSAFITLPILSVAMLPFVLLELLVAFLQGYVYITLVVSYYQDILVPH